MNDRDVDSHGNCSKCGGTHYGSYMCPMSPSPQGEDPTPDRGPLVGNTSKPVATEPQGNAGESPAPIPLTSNSLIQYLRVCADLAEAPGDDQDGLAYVSPIKLREAITEIERLTRENESLRAGRTNSQRVNDNGAQEIDRMRAALDETLEELQLDDSRHDLMAKIISALSGEPRSDHETGGKEPEAWLFHCWKPGSHAVYASVEKADNSWWPEHPNTPWKGVTRTALVKHGAPELIHGEPPPSERFAEKASERQPLEQHPDYCRAHGDHLIDSPACELAREHERRSEKATGELTQEEMERRGQIMRELSAKANCEHTWEPAPDRDNLNRMRCRLCGEASK